MKGGQRSAWPPASPQPRHRLLVPLFAWTLMLALPLAGCSDRASGTPARQGRGAETLVPVTVGEVVQKTVPVQVRAIGTVQASSTVSVKSQVSGELLRVHLTEGQDVRKGDLLFTIDPRPFEAALQQAEANLARDRAQLQQAEAALAQHQAEVQQAEANLARDLAQLENARVQERRYRDLVEKGFVAQEQYDQVRTNAAALDATVQADRAALANARAALRAAQAAIDNARAAIRGDQAMVEARRLQLGYTVIRAPIDGRTGNLIVHQGNVVKENDASLVVINQIHPIHVALSVPEQSLADIKRYHAAGGVKVEALVPDQARRPAPGKLTFINNTVDPATGTIQLKATFSNSDNALWPGQFVDVVLTLTTQPNAIVVPSQAIQTGQQGPYVFVVKPDLTVESRPVAVGRTLERETVVERGLARGERVVTDGQLRLFPGAKVDIKPSRAG